MTNPTPHGQVPEALIDLIDAYAETRHRCGGIYNARTEAARNAVIEALSGVQALSAAPEAIAKLRHLYQNMVNGAVRDTASAKRIAEGLLAPAIEALERATPPAEQQAPKETLGGVNGWRDISTAPKDGSRFVATGHNYGLYSEVRHTCVAQWFQGCWMEASDWNETSELKYLTHWMPLPSPPDDVAAPAEQQAAPKAAQVDPDKLMRDCLALLESFDYEDDEDSQSKAFFNAHINADWFFHVKHSIERQLEAKWGTQPQAGAVPQGWKAVPVNPTPEMWKAAKSVPDPNPPYPPHYGLVWDAMLAASPTPPAEQQAAYKAVPGEQNTVPAEWLEQAYREAWAACRDAETIGEEAEDWAFGNSTANSRMIDAQQAAPQQDAQEPAAYVHVPHYTVEGKVRPVVSFEKYQQDYADGIYSTRIPLYTAPQPAPEPLSEMPYEKRKSIQEGEQISASDAWFKARHEMLDTLDRRNVFSAGFDRGWSAAIAAQGGKDA